MTTTTRISFSNVLKSPGKSNEMRHEQTLAPLDYVRDEITLILKNKKKLQFENDLEKQINEEGVRKKYVKIY